MFLFNLLPIFGILLASGLHEFGIPYYDRIPEFLEPVVLPELIELLGVCESLTEAKSVVRHYLFNYEIFIPEEEGLEPSSPVNSVEIKNEAAKPDVTPNTSELPLEKNFLCKEKTRVPKKLNPLGIFEYSFQLFLEKNLFSMVEATWTVIHSSTWP